LIVQQGPVQRAPASTSVVDVLDHVLDKGIVIDALIRVSLVGIERLHRDVPETLRHGPENASRETIGVKRYACRRM